MTPPGPGAEVALDHLSLLARAVAGRSMTVMQVPDTVVYTDGACIYLPSAPDHVHRLAVAGQAALVAAGSLSSAMMVRLTGHSTLTQRYLVLESVRAARLLDSVLPIPIAAHLAGLRDGPVSSTARESLRWARDRRQHVPEAPEWLGTIKPIPVLRTAPRSLSGTPAPADSTAKRDEEELHGLATADADSQRNRFLELFTLPVRNPFASRLKNLFGSGPAPSGPHAAQRTGTDELTVRRRVGVATPGSRITAAAAVVDTSLKRSGTRYPEWDSKYQKYRRDWCTVSHVDPVISLDATPPTATTDEPLRRQLARLGLGHERHRRQEDGDDLDLTALIDATVDLAAGATSDGRVYEVRRHTARDLGVLVLLDTTGSTSASNSAHTVFDEQRQLTANLVTALDSLGNRVAAYGFHSRGRNMVRFNRIKAFDDRWDQSARHRLHALKPGGFTRLGAAIRHATHLLDDDSGTSQRLMILVGDGFPYETGYQDRYAEDDTRRALAEAVARGVGCLCLDIASDTDGDMLERVWGDVPHSRLTACSDLAGQVHRLVRSALRDASASKRSVRSTDTIHHDATPIRLLRTTT